MTTNAIEKALWQALSNPKEMQRFRDDAPTYLKDFKLEEGERSAIVSWDVSQLVSRGVNPLLVTQAFSAIFGMQAMGEYLGKINGAAPG